MRCDLLPAVGLVAVLAASSARAGISTTTLPSTTITTSTTTITSTTLPAQLLSGKKLLLKWRPDETKKSLLNLLSKDADLTLGDGPDSADDPTLHGGSLRIYAAGGDGFDDTYVIPAERWAYLRKKPQPPPSPGPYAAAAPGAIIGYRIHKTDPLTSLLVKPGKQVKIVARGTALGHTLASDPEPVLVELRLGDERYCLAFGGTVRFTADKKYLAKNSTTAEAACPP